MLAVGLVDVFSSENVEGPAFKPVSTGHGLDSAVIFGVDVDEEDDRERGQEQGGRAVYTHAIFDWTVVI
jgi:hypothetical protein